MAMADACTETGAALIVFDPNLNDLPSSGEDYVSIHLSLSIYASIYLSMSIPSIHLYLSIYLILALIVFNPNLGDRPS